MTHESQINEQASKESIDDHKTETRPTMSSLQEHKTTIQSVQEQKELELTVDKEIVQQAIISIKSKDVTWTDWESVNTRHTHKEFIIGSSSLEPSSNPLQFRVGIKTNKNTENSTFFVETFHKKNPEISTEIFSGNSQKLSMEVLPNILEQLTKESQIRKSMYENYGITVYPGDNWGEKTKIIPKSIVSPVINDEDVYGTNFILPRMEVMQKFQDKLHLFPPKGKAFMENLKQDNYTIFLSSDDVHMISSYLPKVAGYVFAGKGFDLMVSRPETSLHEFFHVIDLDIDSNTNGLLPETASPTDIFWNKYIKNSGSFWQHGTKKKGTSLAEAVKIKNPTEYAFKDHNESYKEVNSSEAKATYAMMLLNDPTFELFQKEGSSKRTGVGYLLRTAAGRKTKDGFVVNEDALERQYAIEILSGQRFEDMYQWALKTPYKIVNADTKADLITEMKAQKVVPYLQQLDPTMSTAKYWQHYFEYHGDMKAYWKKYKKDA